MFWYYQGAADLKDLPVLGKYKSQQWGCSSTKVLTISRNTENCTWNLEREYQSGVNSLLCL